ncbi:MAG: hypothetical protein WBE32_10275 [Pseudolabrys sp.]
MVKFRLPEMRTPILAASYYRCGNHVGVKKSAAGTALPRLVKIFNKFDCVEFDESFR